MGSRSDGTGRRGLIQALLGTGFAASIVSFVYPAFRFMLPPAVSAPSVDEVTAAEVGDLQANSGVIFKFGARPAILILTESGEFRAFSAVCTHLNCTVQYEQSSQQIWCACHNGRFDLRGRVVSGPPPDPLEEYSVNVLGEDVVVSRKTSA